MKKSMKNKIIALAMLVFSPALLAQTSMELEEACYGDVELTELIVQLSETGETTIDLLTDSELSQVIAFLGKKDIAGLLPPEKLAAALTACAEGRILQSRNKQILNSQPQ